MNAWEGREGGGGESSTGYLADQNAYIKFHLMKKKNNQVLKTVVIIFRPIRESDNLLMKVSTTVLMMILVK
jgi:hypothetical protein